ncbi:hypothetical protein FOCC_FOCC001726 [Frankliniella occidentalis]|nr:hypothetical protein FOCC_FOCC001726 [Frankliniella occidentalis]
MASTLVLDSVEDKNPDNALIVLINSDGTVTVDPQVLKSVLENKQDATVSVVRVGKPIPRDSGIDSDIGDVSQVNLTVEGFYSPSAATSQDLIDCLTNGDDEEDDIDISSLNIVDPASDAIHIDHCYTNKLSNRQILQLSVGDLKADLQAQLEEPDGLENCPVFRQDGATRGKLKFRTLRGGKKQDLSGRRSVVVSNDSLETSATTLQHLVLKPPPNSPASATLVPLVKPLVLKQPPPSTPASVSVVKILTHCDLKVLAKLTVKLVDTTHTNVNFKCITIPLAEKQIYSTSAIERVDHILHREGG